MEMAKTSEIGSMFRITVKEYSWLWKRASLGLAIVLEEIRKRRTRKSSERSVSTSTNCAHGKMANLTPHSFNLWRTVSAMTEDTQSMIPVPKRNSDLNGHMNLIKDSNKRWSGT